MDSKPHVGTDVWKRREERSDDKQDDEDEYG